MTIEDYKDDHASSEQTVTAHSSSRLGWFRAGAEVLVRGAFNIAPLVGAGYSKVAGYPGVMTNAMLGLAGIVTLANVVSLFELNNTNMSMK